MAFVISKDTHLHRDYRTEKRLFWIAFGAGIGIFCLWMLILFAVPRPEIGFVLAAPILSFCLLYFAKTRYSQLSILAAGIRGEKQTLNILKELDNKYWIVTNASVTYKGRSSELDFVVIGPTGVCIVESKHVSGSVLADPEAKYWNRVKISHSGVERTKNFYSPIQQVNTHLYRLQKVLQEEGLAVNLDRAVFFSDPDTQVKFTQRPTETPVFWGEKGRDMLLAYIRKVRTQLTPQEVLQIAEVLHKK